MTMKEKSQGNLATDESFHIYFNMYLIEVRHMWDPLWGVFAVSLSNDFW